MTKKSVGDIAVANKAVLVRVDYNVSIKNGIVADDTRIRQSLSTIKHILSHKPKRVVLVSHLGDPEGKDEKYTLQPVANHLASLLGRPVRLVKDYTLANVQKELVKYVEGEVIMLENVRFYRGETLNSHSFSKKLASLGDIFVNDAFGSCHRAHASVVGVADYLPAVAGLLLEREVEIIGKTLEKPQPPFIVVLGGAKATTKIPMIERLMTKADYVLLGGGVANTFLKAFGYRIGRSVYSPESVRLAQTLIWRATRVDTKLFLPTDLVVGSLTQESKIGEVLRDEIPTQLQALDIGPKTQKEYRDIIAKAKTIIWNGPMGANEIPVFIDGTQAIYDAIVANKNAVSIVGGGDTLTSIRGNNHLDNITHISTGGGAMLEFIEKGTLPGLEALNDK